jgi:hypothetical protein
VGRDAADVRSDERRYFRCFRMYAIQIGAKGDVHPGKAWLKYRGMLQQSRVPFRIDRGGSGFPDTGVDRGVKLVDFFPRRGDVEVVAKPRLLGDASSEIRAALDIFYQLSSFF